MTDGPSPRQSAFLVIGDEILSGRTIEGNLAYLAERLNIIGAPLAEARIVSDAPTEIAAALNALRGRYAYVFTSGGIGPTHDDRTTEAVAMAFGLTVEVSGLADARLSAHYGEDYNIARQKMAMTPDGAALIDNPISVAPGFIVENVFVMAGVPSVFRAMVDAVAPTLDGGETVHSESLSAFVREGDLAAGLADIENAHPGVSLGSYPFFSQGRVGASVVARGVDLGRVRAAIKAVDALMRTLGARPQAERP